MAPMRLHHLALRTQDLARLEQFYAEVLGLPVVARRSGRSVWLQAEGVVLMLERADANEPGVPVASMDLVAFAIDANDFVEREAALTRAGIAVEGRTDYTLYVRDPDGRRVGLSHYTFD